MAVPIESFLTPNLTNMLISFVIPFLIFFAILLFVFKKTGVFGTNSFIYILISLGLTTMIWAVNPGGIFQFLASYLFQIGVMGSVVALLMVFFLILWTVVREGISMAEKLKSPEQRLQQLGKQEEKLLKEIHSSSLFMSTGKREERLRRLKDVEDDIRRLQLFLRARRR